MKKLVLILFSGILFSSFSKVEAGTPGGRASATSTPASIGKPWENRNLAGEQTMLRDRTTKHFRNQNGKMTAYMATGSIHYKENGNWYDIDNTITSNTTNLHAECSYASLTNAFKTYYPANPFNGFVNVDYNGLNYKERIISVSFTDINGKKLGTLPINESLKVIISGNRIIYKNIAKNMDLVFTQGNDGKKMDLVLNERTALSLVPANATNLVITEEVLLPQGVNVTANNDGINILKNGELQVNYPLPVAIETGDQSKNYSDDNDLMNNGQITYEQSNTGILIHSSFAVNWLKDESRSFPVKLDPTANYGPFNIAMATGRMTTATGAKTSGFLRLSGNNSFTWAKFDISSLATVGAIGIDSAYYYGYHYTTTGADKFADIRGMAATDPVSALNTAIVTQINNGPLYKSNYVFGGSTFQWRSAMLDTTLADTAIFSSITRGWFAIGMKYTSGLTTFMYQHGYDGTAGLINYLEISYETAPCTNPANAGYVNGASLVCGGTNTVLNVVGSTVGTGTTFQWQSSPDSLTWTNITNATSTNLNTLINADSMYYRCEVMCSMGTPAYTNAFMVKADFHHVTALTPYEEGFESITAANQLPNCMAATNFPTITSTYVAATGTNGQAARTGNKYASFRYACNDFFFTKGVKLDANVTYSFSTWYVTDGGYNGGWDSLALYIATAPNRASATLLPGTTVTYPTNTTYQKLTGSFTPSTTGVYRFAVKVVDAGIPWYLTIDDLKIEVASAPTVLTRGASNITTAAATLAGDITSNGGAAVSQSGIVYSLSPNPVRGGIGVVDSATNPLTGINGFSVNVNGLSLSTTYYYRAYAMNSVGTSYGADSTFTTNATAVIPSVQRIAATNILGYTATIGGNITSDGGSAVTASGVVYSTTTNPVLGGPGVIDSTTIPVSAMGSYTINLAGLMPGTKYYFTAYATNSIGTAYSTMDSFTTAPVISTFPYNQNFDVVSGNNGWSTVATGGPTDPNDWAVGTPAKSFISAAVSAPNAWVTKLTGAYATYHNGAVVSPQFDFTALTANPILRFTHKFITESCCDGGWLEMSINGGAWTKVENVVGTGANFNTTNGTSWYNSTTQGNSWSDNSTLFSSNINGWITSSIALPGAAGQGNVKFRFRFVSDVSVEDDGWAVDNIEVFIPSPPVVLTGTSANVTTSNATLAGNITSNGGNAVTASGIVFSTNPNPVRGGFGVIDSATNPLVTGGAFTIYTTALSASTTYYFRAYAVNALGTSYGPDSSFITPASAIAPTVWTNGVTNLTTTSVKLGGNITSDGGAPVTSSGIVYSTSPNPIIGAPGVVDSTTSPVIGINTFMVNPTGLTHSTKYYYRAYAANAIGTSYSPDDSFTTAPIVSAFPYTQNFDGVGTTGWSTAPFNIGDINEWVMGTPAKTVISAASSAPNCWITKTVGNYSSYHNGSLISPQFDFSALTAGPILRFKHKFVTEVNCCDGGWVEMSINGGAWTKVENVLGTAPSFNTPNAASWYNYAIGQGNAWNGNSTTIAGNVGGWLTSQVPLPGAAGQSDVKFRFRFYSDVSAEYDGWAIDDIEVFVVTTPTVTASNVVATPGSTNANVTFTAGNGDGRLVVARLTTDVAVPPTDNTLYTANAAFGSGNTTGTGNYVVYNGSGTSVNVTGLTQLTNYTFDVYEYNGRFMHVKFASAANTNTTTTPVKLISFAGAAQRGSSVLTWATASELNNRGFNVERSIDGKNFEFVTFVKGSGNSSSVLRYSTIDADAFAKTGSAKIYYRLKQIDFNGKSEYSNVISVTNNEKVSFNATAYPVPFNNELNLKVDGAVDGNATVSLTDILGRTVFEQVFTLDNGSNVINIHNLELKSGVYFLKLIQGNQTDVINIIRK